MSKKPKIPNTDIPEDYFTKGRQEYDYMCKITSQEAIKAVRYSGASFDELVAEGYVGAAKAADKFKPDLGNKFSTYLYLNIMYYIKNAANKHLKLYGYQKTVSLDSLVEDSDNEDNSNNSIMNTHAELIVDDVYNEIELSNLLSKLDPIQRKVLEYKIKGYSDDGIAKTIVDENGVNHLNRLKVNSIRHKAINKLKTILS